MIFEGVATPPPFEEARGWRLTHLYSCDSGHNKNTVFDQGGEGSINVASSVQPVPKSLIPLVSGTIHCFIKNV